MSALCPSVTIRHGRKVGDYGRIRPLSISMIGYTFAKSTGLQSSPVLSRPPGYLLQRYSSRREKVSLISKRNRKQPPVERAWVVPALQAVAALGSVVTAIVRFLHES